MWKNTDKNRKVLKFLPSGSRKIYMCSELWEWERQNLNKGCYAGRMFSAPSLISVILFSRINLDPILYRFQSEKCKDLNLKSVHLYLLCSVYIQHTTNFNSRGPTNHFVFAKAAVIFTSWYKDVNKPFNTFYDKCCKKFHKTKLAI